MRRPIVHVDCIPLGFVNSWRPGLYIPKRLQTSDGNFLSVFEILRGEIGWPEHVNGVWTHTQGMYDRQDLSIIDNSPVEIRAVAEEMDDQLNDRISYLDERENQIQSEIARILESTHWHGKSRVRLGSEFIKSYPELMAPY